MKIDLGQKRRNQTLWSFVLFAFGVVLYFGLPFEPSFLILLGINIVLLGLLFWKVRSAKQNVRLFLKNVIMYQE